MDRLKKAIASVALLLFGAVPAFAQVQCGTVTTCPQASSPFGGAEILYMVQGGVSKRTTVAQLGSAVAPFIVLTPGTSPISPKTNGGVLYDNNGILGDSTTLPTGLTAPNFTLTGDVLVKPTFTSANPGNAGVYSQLANPANGYSTIFNGAQFSLGPAIPASGQFGQNVVGIQSALVATLNIAASDPAGNAGFASASYCLTNSVATGCVGAFGFGGTTIAGSSQWAANYLVGNCAFQGCTVGLNNTVSYGAEFNFSIMAPAVNSPTRGLYFIGNSTITQTNANASTIFAAIDIDSPGITQTPHLQWLTAIKTENGSTSTGLSIGALGTVANSGSQSIVLNSVNSIGGGAQGIIQDDPGGDMLLTPTANGAVALQDGNGGTNFETAAAFGTSGASFPKLLVAGALCNSASGVVSTTTGKCSGNDPSDVVSVFGRTGVVVATSGDYTVGQVTGAAPLASPTFTGTMNINAVTGGGAAAKFVCTDSSGIVVLSGTAC